MKTFIKNAQELQNKSAEKPVLASYACKLNRIPFFQTAELFENARENFFLLSYPNGQRKFFASGTIDLSLNSNGLIKDTNDKAKNLQNKVFNNWNKHTLKTVPIFLGGQKFRPLEKAGIWDDFPDANWYIPRFIVMESCGSSFLIFNFAFSELNDPENILREFEEIFNILKSSPLPGWHNKAKICSTIGVHLKGKEDWEEMVEKALGKISSGIIQKVVLSRCVHVELDKAPSSSMLIEELAIKYPECHNFIYKINDSVFFGASPEKIAKFEDGILYTDALAGSAPRGSNDAEDEMFAAGLLNSIKDRMEHSTVIDYINGVLTKYCSAIGHASEPIVKKLKNILHLWTPIEGKLRHEADILEIVKALHPTPAVCGTPQNKAMELIAELENYPRGLYAGVVGWFNPFSEGEFFVGIRSALLKGRELYLFAGGGIVQGSVPAQEFNETVIKLNPILSIFEYEKTI